jgi:hypothetical protein
LVDRQENVVAHQLAVQARASCSSFSLVLVVAISSVVLHMLSTPTCKLGSLWHHLCTARLIVKSKCFIKKSAYFILFYFICQAEMNKSVKCKWLRAPPAGRNTRRRTDHQVSSKLRESTHVHTQFYP